MPAKSMNAGFVELTSFHAQADKSLLYVAVGAVSRTTTQGGIHSGLQLWVITLKPNSHLNALHLSIAMQMVWTPIIWSAFLFQIWPN